MKITTDKGTTVHLNILGSELVFTDSARQESALEVRMEHGAYVQDFVVVQRPSMTFVYSADHLESGPRPPWAILHNGNRWLPYLVIDHVGAWTPSGAEPERKLDWAVGPLEKVFLAGSEA